MKTVHCPMCGRAVRVRTNKFGDEIYARHRMKTHSQLHDEIWGKADSARDEARQEAIDSSAANPLAFSETEIDCPNSGQPL